VFAINLKEVLRVHKSKYVDLVQKPIVVMRLKEGHDPLEEFGYNSSDCNLLFDIHFFMIIDDYL